MEKTDDDAERYVRWCKRTGVSRPLLLDFVILSSNMFLKKGLRICEHFFNKGYQVNFFTELVGITPL